MNLMRCTMASFSSKLWMLVTVLLATTVRPAWCQPNIVVVMVDDLGYADFNQKDMPKLWSISRLGVQMRLYSHQNSQPTRAAFLTGNDPSRYQMHQEHDDPRFYAEPVSGITNATVADTLRSVGYSTYHIGKWDVGKYDAEQQFARGFDEYLTRLEINGVSYGSSRDDISTFHDAAMKVFEHASRPFFLYLAHHDPGNANEQLTYEERIATLDDQLADLFAALPPDTVFVFMSDSGAGQDQGSNAPFQGWKGDYFEGAIRVANFVTGIKPSEEPIWVGDFHETFAELSGAATPITDGGSILKPTVHRGLANTQTYLVPYIKKRKAEGRKIRGKFAAIQQWRKYVRIGRYRDDQSLISVTEEFYDLRRDPGEEANQIYNPIYRSADRPDAIKV